ncbi:hypothetical protein Naga_103395g1, partial [Nannochloropsis gaditana]
REGGRDKSVLLLPMHAPLALVPSLLEEPLLPLLPSLPSHWLPGSKHRTHVAFEPSQSARTPCLSRVLSYSHSPSRPSTSHIHVCICSNIYTLTFDLFPLSSDFPYVCTLGGGYKEAPRAILAWKAAGLLPSLTETDYENLFSGTYCRVFGVTGREG